MIRSLRTGVSGIQSHQVRMDVVGNNIANVNTFGFKRGRTAFTDVLGQKLLGTTSSSSGAATNSSFVGFGVNVGSIDRNWNQGALEHTNFAEDLALNGDGFFVVNNGDRDLLSRVGRFEFNKDGQLVNGRGDKVQGFAMDANGVADMGALEDVKVNWASQAEAKHTGNVIAGGNISADAAVGAEVNLSTTIYDEQGTPHAALMTLTKTADNAWDYSVDYNGTETTPPFTTATGSVTFDVDGQLVDNSDITVAWDPAYVASATDFAVNIENLTQFSGSSTAVVREQDGYQSGKLIGFAFGSDGTLSLNYSNGVINSVFQLAISTVNNANGLENLGEGILGATAASGSLVLGRAGSEIETAVVAGALEMSNVDLATEFTDMIISQRGYQASARVITTSDEILMETVNLKR